MPSKVIDFIKKWVAKEKVLINHCVQALFSVSQGADTEKTRSRKDLAAKKNKA